MKDKSIKKAVKSEKRDRKLAANVNELVASPIIPGDVKRCIAQLHENLYRGEEGEKPDYEL